jgi:hypothetical protein
MSRIGFLFFLAGKPFRPCQFFLFRHNNPPLLLMTCYSVARKTGFEVWRNELKRHRFSLWEMLQANLKITGTENRFDVSF